MSPNFVPTTFLGLNTPYNQCKAVLIGCPMDDTSSFRPGTRFGPGAIRTHSLGLETYSPHLKVDIEDIKATDMGDLDLPFGKKEKAISLIADTAKDILSEGKILLSIGGEHLISLPLIAQSQNIHKNLKVIHMDAHADLRDEYQGEKLSHATVMHRVLDLVGGGNLYQIGIRSGIKKEFDLIKDLSSLYSLDGSGLSRLKKSIGPCPCYITLDLDILEPGLFQAVGTPEPGGIDFVKLLDIIYYLRGLNIIGLDVVEYNPLLDPCGQCSLAAAKIIRELLISFSA